MQIETQAKQLMKGTYARRGTVHNKHLQITFHPIEIEGAYYCTLLALCKHAASE